MVHHFFLFFGSINSCFLYNCFPHIINLACKAVLAAITNIKYADDSAPSYEDYEPSAFSHDCIANIRSLVNAVNSLISPFLSLFMKFTDSQQ